MIKFLKQSMIFAVILLVSTLISKVIPIPLPASVIGMVLLFCLLYTNVLKLEDVEEISTSLLTIIAFLFVPSGISLINSLDIMKDNGIYIVLMIVFATTILLYSTAFVGRYLVKLQDRRKNEGNK